MDIVLPGGDFLDAWGDWWRQDTTDQTKVIIEPVQADNTMRKVEVIIGLVLLLILVNVL